ncbi:AEC family transporter [Bifidobacterium choerinum]|uniref:Permease n=1 Tax=Bifidobacterium choerinum TaxID=35760 RepID=A0A2D3D4Z4_9BIFI|nr:AEC family transporter [Bifidobacterium choerinum]ATU20197.1 permease [Bifidobacterium choerinum]
MLTLLQPISLLCIIVVGYLFKRRGLFGPRDYRIIQVVLFDLVLPGSIVYSFARNPHDLSLLWLSAYGFVVALIPVVVIYLATSRHPIASRAFLMLNASGLNIGCFCFPVVQAFLGSAAVVPAAMFDIGNCIMVAAGTNVMTQTLLHIRPGRTLAEQGAGDTPTLPYEKPTDPDARRLARRSLRRTILKGFVGSVPFDVYVVMIVLTAIGVTLPVWFADLFAPLANANASVAMLMVGMLMDVPSDRRDVLAVLRVIAWRLPFGLLFAAAAWFLLPFDPMIREATMMCCLAPIAVFSTLFTDEVLGNARLAGFSLAVTAAISILLMTGAHMLIAAGML